MAQFPALPLFTDAVVADCYHLTDEEFGRYMRLLILMWRTPGCRIPEDPNWISKRINCDALAYAQLIHPILQEFCTVISEDGCKHWVQKRLRKEYAYVQDLSAKRKKAANKRWGKDQGTENIENTGMQSTMQNTSEAYAPTPTPTPTNNILKGKKYGTKKSRKPSSYDITKSIADEYSEPEG